MEGEWRDLQMSPFCLSIAAPSYPIGCVLYTIIPISIIACSYCSSRSSCILSEINVFFYCLLLLRHPPSAGGLVHKNLASITMESVYESLEDSRDMKEDEEDLESIIRNAK